MHAVIRKGKERFEEKGRMADRVRLQELDDCIAVSFDAGDEKIMAIGTKMQEMCEAFLKNMQMISNGTKKGK